MAELLRLIDLPTIASERVQISDVACLSSTDGLCTIDPSMLLSIFRFPPLESIILSKATSLIVVASALVFRSKSAPVADVIAHADVAANLLVGSLAGAWLGASWATRTHRTTLYKVIAVLLVAIAGVLLFGHDPTGAAAATLDGWTLWIAGAAAGFVIGRISPFR